MPGIYIHIPFCKQACHYCNFHFSTSLDLKDDMVNALISEISLVTATQDEEVETLYFGGGTPSLLTTSDLQRILEAVRSKFSVAESAEITLEANPDDISSEKLSEWKHAGINRLSIGIQSFHEDDLIWMNRVHNALQALQCILMAKEQGFFISIDLIYGTPGLTDDKWRKNIEQFLELNIEHLSSYALTVEPSTALDKMIRLHKKQPVDTDQQASQFKILTDKMTKAGYEHYEISNFAKPGFRSKHNSSYWQGRSYIGFGPSAHSFDGKKRKWNVSNNIQYINAVRNGKIPAEEEELTLTQQLNERIMISLRTSEGLDMMLISQLFSDMHAHQILQSAKKYIDNGKIIMRENSLVLTQAGKLFADGIAADLFFD